MNRAMLNEIQSASYIGGVLSFNNIFARKPITSSHNLQVDSLSRNFKAAVGADIDTRIDVNAS